MAQVGVYIHNGVRFREQPNGTNIHIHEDGTSTVYRKEAYFPPYEIHALKGWRKLIWDDSRKQPFAHKIQGQEGYEFSVMNWNHLRGGKYDMPIVSVLPFPEQAPFQAFAEFCRLPKSVIKNLRGGGLVVIHHYDPECLVGGTYHPGYPKKEQYAHVFHVDGKWFSPFCRRLIDAAYCLDTGSVI